MEINYWIQYWAELHKNEMYEYPEEIVIHNDFIKQHTYQEFLDAFKELYNIIKNIYNDFITQPADMNMTLYKSNEHRLFSNQSRTSSVESYQYVDLLYILGNLGELKNGLLYLEISKIKDYAKTLKFKVSKLGDLLKKLTEYGFQIIGMQEDKLPKGGEIQFLHNNTTLIFLIKQLSIKAMKCDRLKDFHRMHYKLLKDDLYTTDYGKDFDSVLDMIKSPKDKETALELHNAIISKGYHFVPFTDQGRYYKSSSDAERNANSLFRIVASDIDRMIPEFLFLFRIKKMDECFDYISSCNDQIQETFSQSDIGCGRKCGRLTYTFKGKEIKRCGCYKPNFRCKPEIKDIPSYLKCVELGN